jgi:cytochrome c-type biogenesis protein
MFADAHMYFGVALAGLVSFLSPCVLPLVPPYLVYLGGTSMEQMTHEEGLARDVWLRVILTSVFFVLGFTTIFVALGAGASAFGQLIGQYKTELATASGVVIVAFGLHFLGVLKIPLLYREARYQAASSGASLMGAYVIGLAFAFGWTPCVGPILATVLAVATREDSLSAGVTLLLAYSLGLGVPFILAAVAIRPFLSFMQTFRRHLGRVEKVMGGLLVCVGLAFVFGQTTLVGNWMLDTFPGLARIEERMTPKSLQGEILKQTAPR